MDPKRKEFGFDLNLGSATVKYEQDESALKAIKKFNGKMWKGRVITVETHQRKREDKADHKEKVKVLRQQVVLKCDDLCPLMCLKPVNCD